MGHLGSIFVTSRHSESGRRGAYTRQAGARLGNRNTFHPTCWWRRDKTAASEYVESQRAARLGLRRDLEACQHLTGRSQKPHWEVRLSPSLRETSPTLRRFKPNFHWCPVSIITTSSHPTVIIEINHRKTLRLISHSNSTRGRRRLDVAGILKEERGGKSSQEIELS